MSTTDAISATFAALADPTRRAILARLAAGEASVSEISAPFSVSMPAISRHLKVLERAGLVTRGRDAQWRPCRLEAAPLKEVADWVEHYRQFWEESFDRLDEYLVKLQTQRGDVDPSRRTAINTISDSPRPSLGAEAASSQPQKANAAKIQQSKISPKPKQNQKQKEQRNGRHQRKS